jgi:hypothetical protein
VATICCFCFWLISVVEDFWVILSY